VGSRVIIAQRGESSVRRVVGDLGHGIAASAA